MGEEEIRLAKPNYGWPEEAKFLLPEGIREHFQVMLGERGRTLRGLWMAKFHDYKARYPELADQLYKMLHRQFPEG